MIFYRAHVACLSLLFNRRALQAAILAYTMVQTTYLLQLNHPTRNGSGVLTGEFQQIAQ